MEHVNGPTASRKAIGTPRGCVLTPHPFKTMRLTGYCSKNQGHSTPAYLAQHRERARHNATLPGKHGDGSITSIKGIGKLRQGVLLPPHLTLVEPMGACSGQNHGYDITTTLARCQERTGRSIPLPSQHANGLGSSYKAAGAPWGAALRPHSPHAEGNQHALQQSDTTNDPMFCGVKNRYVLRTTPWSQGIEQEQSLTFRQGAGERFVSDWGHGDDAYRGTSTHHRSADNVPAQLSGQETQKLHFQQVPSTSASVNSPSALIQVQLWQLSRNYQKVELKNIDYQWGAIVVGDPRFLAITGRRSDSYGAQTTWNTPHDRDVLHQGAQPTRKWQFPILETIRRSQSDLTSADVAVVHTKGGTKVSTLALQVASRGPAASHDTHTIIPGKNSWVAKRFREADLENSGQMMISKRPPLASKSAESTSGRGDTRAASVGACVNPWDLGRCAAPGHQDGVRTVKTVPSQRAQWSLQVRPNLAKINKKWKNSTSA